MFCLSVYCPIITRTNGLLLLVCNDISFEGTCLPTPNEVELPMCKLCKVFKNSPLLNDCVLNYFQNDVCSRPTL